MARPLRLCLPCAFYHVMSRGNAKGLIFLDAEDCERFLRVLREMVERSSVTLYAYCLMPNHFHLVLRTKDANLSAALHYLNGVYSQWWNRRHARCGHVLQGRFKAQLIQNERYLAAACLYVLRNPVRAHLVRLPEDWRWSSCRASFELTDVAPFLDTSLVRRLLPDRNGGRSTCAPADDAGREELEAEVGQAIAGHTLFIGDPSFLEEQRKALGGSARARVPRREWRPIRPPLSELIPGTWRSTERHLLEAHDVWGFTQAEIAAHLGLHVDAVGRVLRRLARTAGTGVRSADLQAGPAELRT